MLGAEYIAEYLHSTVNRVFTFPGGTVAPIYDALSSLNCPIHVARHEQGAGYAALACSRLTGKPEVVMVTSGPGVTNLITVLADAFYDSTPLVALTGQVGTGDLQAQRHVRQKGFQEVNTLDLVRSVVKAAFRPMSADELPTIMDKAFRIAASGRPGPVVIDLPMDVQRAAFEHKMDDAIVSDDAPGTSILDLREISQYLAECSSPIILAGQGVLISGAASLLREFASRHTIPVVASLLGIGSISGDSPLYAGFVGHTGSQVCGMALQEADCVLILGSRLDVRQTGTVVDKFCPKARIIRVDIDSDELDYPRVRMDFNVLADVKDVLAELVRIPLPSDEIICKRLKWLELIARWREKYPLDAPAFAHENLSGPLVVKTFNKLTAGHRVIVSTGVGAHQHWVARHFNFDYPDRVLLTSGGHGAMGYDVPSIMGAAICRPDVTPICFAGDASFQINMQEMQFAASYNLPVRIVILDNNRMAMVSQFQKITWGKDPATGHVYNPDFTAIAKAYGYASESISKTELLEDAVKRCLMSKGPALLHCSINPSDDVIPMLLGGQTLDGMYPYRQ